MAGISLGTGNQDGTSFAVDPETAKYPDPEPRWSLTAKGERGARLYLVGLVAAELRQLHGALGAVVGETIDDELCDFLAEIIRLERECCCLPVTGVGRIPCLWCRAAALLWRYDPDDGKGPAQTSSAANRHLARTAGCTGNGTPEKVPCPCYFCRQKRREAEKKEATAG